MRREQMFPTLDPSEIERVRRARRNSNSRLCVRRATLNHEPQLAFYAAIDMVSDWPPDLV